MNIYILYDYNKYYFVDYDTNLVYNTYNITKSIGFITIDDDSNTDIMWY